MMLSRLRNVFGVIARNVQTESRVRSFSVASTALAGREIEILKGSTVDASSRIGSYTYIGSNTNITKSTIGRYCSIANNVSVGQGEHRLDYISTSARFYESPWEVLTAGECELASDVWVGVDAVILRGVKIGFGAAVAANAVVTRDVPNFAVVAGIPAKIIKYRFPESMQNTILASLWWEKEHAAAAIALNQLQQGFEGA